MSVKLNTIPEYISANIGKGGQAAKRHWMILIMMINFHEWRIFIANAYPAPPTLSKLLVHEPRKKVILK